MTPPPNRYIDLFAGCGGLSEGFERSDCFEGVAHVEWDSAAARTLRRRLRERWGYVDADSRVLQADIQKTRELLGGGDAVDGTPHVGLDRLVELAGGVELVIGGPPCQAYSLAGRIRDAHGMQLDYRNYLFESYLEVVRRYTPSMVVFENVPGFLSAAPGGMRVVDRVARAFDAAGYVLRCEFRSCVVDMADFGVPQHRKRVILLGVAKSAFGTHASHVLERAYETLAEHRVARFSTVQDAIGSLDKFMPAPGRSDCKPSHLPRGSIVSDHEPRYHSRRDQQIFRRLAADAARKVPRLQEIAALKALYTEVTGKVSNIHKYHVLRPDAPSNLIPAHLYKDGLRHIHFDPAQARSLTVREAACLQSFPLDYQFEGSRGDRYKMIGNAVPPRFAQYLASAIAETLAAFRSSRLGGSRTARGHRKTKGRKASRVSRCV